MPFKSTHLSSVVRGLVYDHRVLYHRGLVSDRRASLHRRGLVFDCCAPSSRRGMVIDRCASLHRRGLVFDRRTSSHLRRLAYDRTPILLSSQRKVVTRSLLHPYKLPPSLSTVCCGIG